MVASGRTSSSCTHGPAAQSKAPTGPLERRHLLPAWRNPAGPHLAADGVTLEAKPVEAHLGLLTDGW